MYLSRLSRELGRPATLDDVPDQELDRIAGQRFDLVWHLGVWQREPAARQVSRSNPEWRQEYRELLPDLTEEDIPGSCFAITGCNGFSFLRRGGIDYPLLPLHRVVESVQSRQGRPSARGAAMFTWRSAILTWTIGASRRRMMARPLIASMYRR